MDTSSYIPNEQRLYIVLRFDRQKLHPDEFLDDLLDGIKAHLPEPGVIDRADGFFDYSVTPWDEAAPHAVIRYSGEISHIDSVVPVKAVAVDTYLADTWLDGELVKSEVERPDVPANQDNPALAAGHLTIREHAAENDNEPTPFDEIPAEWIAQNVPQRYGLNYVTFTYDPDAWVPATHAGTCGINGYHLNRAAMRAQWYNPTARFPYLCDRHYARRRRLRFGDAIRTERIPLPVDDNYRTEVRQYWMDRRCYDCGSTWGEHFGELCPGGTGRWQSAPELVGYNGNGEPVYRGDPDEDFVVPTAEPTAETPPDVEPQPFTFEVEVELPVAFPTANDTRQVVLTNARTVFTNETAAWTEVTEADLMAPPEEA